MLPSVFDFLRNCSLNCPYEASLTPSLIRNEAMKMKTLKIKHLSKLHKVRAKITTVESDVSDSNSIHFAKV
jgi:hypothetical protein